MKYNHTYHHKRITFRWVMIFLLSGLLLTSCNTKKHLQPGQQFVKKNSVTIKGDMSRSAKTSLSYQMGQLAKQKPNTRFLKAFRTRLWWYYKAQEETQQDTSKFYNFILNRVAEAPVIYDPEQAEKTAESMEFYLNNRGYFDADVSYDDTLKRKKKTINIIYRAELNNPLRIGELKFESNNPLIQSILDSTAKASFLKSGNLVSKTSFDQEKTRIVRTMRNKGLLYFYPNYVFFEGDSSDYKANVTVKINPPEEADVKLYHINNIIVHTQYYPAQSIYAINDTTLYEGIKLVKKQDDDFMIKYQPVLSSILIKKGARYNLQLHEETSRRLGGLSVYKFVSIKYIPSDTLDINGKNYLDCVIYLTPDKKMQWGSDLEVNTIRDNVIGDAIGTFLSINYEDRNFLNGSELLSANASGGVEFALGDSTRLLNTVDLRFQSDLYLPRVYLNSPNFPFNGAQARLSLSYNYLSRVRQFTYNSMTTSFGFDLKKKKNTSSVVNIFSFNYLDPTLDSVFQATTLAGQELLIRSFDPQFIIGGNYAFSYTGKPNPSGGVFALRTNLELTGNWLNILDQFIDKDNPFELGNGITYSQFARGEIDGRYTITKRRTEAAFRIASGIGLPYGNSAETGLPYVKQFFAGGTTSIRAWRIRELGPGSFVDTSNVTIPYQAGDFLLEANAEYRFDMRFIHNYLEGAVFLDAGNIWSLTDGSDGGSKLLTNNFYKQIAIGTGFGFRIDFGYFLIRIDLAWKLRTPYLNSRNSYWVYGGNHQFKLSDGRVNLAIGYPF